mmetsp:Transcript_7812/g.13607  ORF Transcript_7812/g.13607 Transcript_7812/m.13607 type:complete len:268 (+) Transcript_7812:219-1022(+)
MGATESPFTNHACDNNSSASARSLGVLTKQRLRNGAKWGDQREGSLSVGGSLSGIWSSAFIGCTSESGGVTCASSKHTMPIDQMSLFMSYGLMDADLLSITSGAIQYGVPMNEYAPTGLLASSAATPKSASLQRPSEHSRMLAALMSRCTIRKLCKYCSPFNDSRVIACISASGIGSLILLKMSFAAPPSQYSILMKISSPFLYAPTKLTMFGCAQSLNTATSFAKSFNSSSSSGSIIFIATILPVGMCFDLYTEPYDPTANSSINS